MGGNTSTTRKFLSQSGDGETPAAPAWQGLQSSDLPSHDHAVGDITSGTLAVEHGGTGLSTAATGDLLYGSAEDTLSALPGNASTTRKFLSQSGDGETPAAPAWQGLQSSDLPSHDHAVGDITSGTLAVEHGGTGLSTAATGDLLYGSAEDTLSALPGNASTTRKFLSQSGDGETPAAPAWQGLQSSDLPSHDHAVGDITSGTLAVEHGGTGLSTAATGDLLYGSAEDTLSALPGNASTTRKFLSQSGDGETPAAPAWQGLQSSDLPTHDHAVGDITSGTLAVEHGGTGLSTIASGKLLYASATDVLAALSLGAGLTISEGVLEAVHLGPELDTTVNTLQARGLSSLAWGTLVSKSIYVPAAGATVRCRARSICKNNSTGAEAIQLRVKIDGNAGSSGSSVSVPGGGGVRRASATHQEAVSGGRFVAVLVEAYANVVGSWEHQRSELFISTDPWDGE